MENPLQDHIVSPQVAKNPAVPTKEGASQTKPAVKKPPVAYHKFSSVILPPTDYYDIKEGDSNPLTQSINYNEWHLSPPRIIERQGSKNLLRKDWTPIDKEKWILSPNCKLCSIEFDFLTRQHHW